ncbi:MAG TPA: methyl-accepting chemotaxis protein [Thermodesulfobacteriota bacterium]
MRFTTIAAAGAGPPGEHTRIRFGLAGKLALVICATLLVVAAGTVFSVQRHLERVLRAEFRSKGQAITASLAAAGPAILDRESVTVDAMLYEFRRIPGVAYVVVTDASQTRGVVSTFGEDLPPGFLAAIRVENPSVAAVRDLSVPAVGGVLDVVQPVITDEPLVLHVGMAHALIDAAIRRAARETLEVFGAGAVVSILVTALLARLVVRPVGQLAATADAVGRGDLRVRPRVRGRDELTLLGRSLAAMADRLSAMIGRIAGSAETVGAASGEIRETLDEVVAGSESQVRLTDATAASMRGVEASLEAVRAKVERVLASAQSSAVSVAALSARTEEVAGAAERLLGASQETSTFAAQIAAASAALDDTAGTFREIVGRTSEAVAAMERALEGVAAQARRTAEVSARTVADADEGQAAVATLAAHVEESRGGGLKAVDAMSRLRSRMSEISRILALIDEVADQTNLLALNAAILAAQAGERGRGFAVVADEIKALAERTGASVKEVTDAIAAIEADAAATVEAVRASSAQSDAGAAAAGRARAALDQIRASAAASGDEVRRIVAAADAHARSREAIRSAMEQLEAVAGAIGRATSEQRGGAARLREVAEQLSTIARAVNAATQDQAEQGRGLADAMDSVADMVREIRDAAADDERQAREVVRALGEIDTIARTTRDRVGRLEQVVDRLRERADDLEAEVGRFTR